MSSFFYPDQPSPSPLFDLFDQPQLPFCPTPDSYHRGLHPHSHHPHRQSAGIFHPPDLRYHGHHRPNSNVLPLDQFCKPEPDRDTFRNNPQNLGYGYPHPFNHHPLQRLRRQKLDQAAFGNPRNTSHPLQATSFPENSPGCGDSIRAERARRLAEAKRRHLGQSSPDEEMKVRVTLPDGRQCVVPISWAKKMQSKYPGILTNSMISPHHDPSESPVQLDQLLATSDSDHATDFYVLDPTQSPSVPVLASSSSSLPSGRRRSPSPSAPKHSPEEQDAAARLIQHQFRTHRSSNHLAELESTFDKLKTEFTYPSPLDLKFVDSPGQFDNPTTSSTKLIYNHPVNRTVQSFEEGLTQLQIKADAILSRGNPKVRIWRKKLIKAVEAQLEQLERFKTEAWSAQRVAHLESLARTKKAEECEEVEMSDEIMNTDVESVSSDRLTLAIPLSGRDVPQPPSRQEEDVIIPVAEHANKPLETLLIPSSSTATTPSAPQETSRPESNPAVLPCIVNPLVSSDGSLVCPASAASLTSDDILVSSV